MTAVTGPSYEASTEYVEASTETAQSIKSSESGIRVGAWTGVAARAGRVDTWATSNALIITSRAALGVLPEQQYLVRRLALPTHQVETDPQRLIQVPSITLLEMRARAVKHDWRITPAGAPIVAAVQGSWAARHARWNSPLAG